MAQLSRTQPLLIDELGYLVTIKPEQANAFFRLMDQRYNRVSDNHHHQSRSDGLASHGLFDKKPLVDALIDRLQHHCITIRIDGPVPAKPRSRRAPAGQLRSGGTTPA